MMNRKRLAVILSNYNHGRYLPESLDSLLRQSRKANEVIIIDDASSDDSVDVLRGYAASHSEIKLICNETNQGYLYNAQMALSMIESDYFFAASADDIYLPDFFQKSMSLLETHAGAGLCSAISLVLKQEGGNPVLFPSPVISMTPSYLNPEQAARTLLKYGSWFMGNTAIYNKKIYQELGGYEVIKDLHSYTDGFIMEIIAFRAGVCYLPEATGIWRRSGKGWSDSIVDNIDEANAIINRARILMQGRYGNFVPDVYPELWERDFRFSLEKKLARTKYVARRKSRSHTTVLVNISRCIRYLADYLYLMGRHTSMRIIRRYINTLGFKLYYNLVIVRKNHL
jgi:glycosyltransferase involved in cell wall biosynthesis